jgi:uncharacterized protein (DUF1015 family)
MAVIAPFRGLRYNPEKVKNLADVVTPPYDVIDEAAQNLYYKRHPYNIIRLEYGKTLSGDNEGDNRYTRAAADYSAWLKEKILTPEKEPSIYVYEQQFNAGGLRKVRTGFICAVKLEQYEKGIILPHEETMPKHKADRLSLMRACRANFSPIFGLYADPEMAVTRTLRDSAGGGPPDVSFTDENGEVHTLRVISDSATIERIKTLMAGKKIFIADGHHRYETALNYKNERSLDTATFPRQGHPACNCVMMTLVNLYDPGLEILPTHRLIRNIGENQLSELPGKLQQNFSLERFPYKPDRENLKDFLSELSRYGSVPYGQRLHRHAFGVYFSGGSLYLAVSKNEEELSIIMPPGKSATWQGLDVSVLHTLIIENYLGIGSELRAMGDHITYTRDEYGALLAVDRGEYQLAFFLNPTLVEEVIEVAAKGEKMPQKSTYFYPKLITGLVINSLE